MASVHLDLTLAGTQNLDNRCGPASVCQGVSVVAELLVQPSSPPARHNNAAGRGVILLRGNVNRRLRLFLLPFAGAGAAPFRSWPAGLRNDLEIYGVQPPGRESRLAEPPFRALRPMVRALADDIDGLVREPFALFGHSLGALLAFELSRELRRRGHGEPAHLVVSAFRAPQLPDRRPALHGLADDRLVAELRRLGGTPPEVLDRPEILAMVLPTLRADLAVSETYVYRHEPPLGCAVTAWGGRSDPDVTETALRDWAATTTGPFDLRRFDGGHMYLTADGVAIARRLGETLLRPARDPAEQA